MKRNRLTLKDYFKKGAIPTESNFSDLIDSMVNQEDDTLTFDGAGPLKIDGDLQLSTDKILSFSDNGSIKSYDNNHRILFRRKENKLELREYGDIVFSSGATKGEETASMVVTNKGSVGIGTDKPTAKLDVKGDIVAKGSLYAGGHPVVYENFEIDLCGSAFESKEGNETFLNVAGVSLGMTAKRGLNTVILDTKGGLKKKKNFDVYGNASLWNDFAVWVNAQAKEGDIVAVASFDAIRNVPKSGTAQVLLRRIGACNAFFAEKGHPRSPYVLLFIQGRGGAMEISHGYKGTNARIKTTYYQLLDNRHSPNMAATSDRHRMYPDTALIYDNIFDAKKQGVITKLGNPSYDDTTYNKTLWQGRKIIRYGADAEKDGNGAQVVVPDGYDTLWVRVLGERWTAMKAYFLDGKKEPLGLWAGGHRAVNCYCPDGSLSDGFNNTANGQYQTCHQWVPIPVGRSGKVALVAQKNTTSHFWLSGVGFSQNPWGHCAQSAVSYHWALNGGNGVKWNTHYWNADVLAELTAKSNWELKVPVMPTGRDKLLYLIEHNNFWNGAMHSGITVNNIPIERFLSTYDNPFARHWNGKYFERYFAARIPAELIAGDARWLSVKINMSKQNISMYFREIGTHDLDITT